MQRALQGEVSEFLGRVRYERVDETGSHRNGYKPRKVRTTAGTVELERPRVCDESRLGLGSRLLCKP
jgi:transposase-like protein